MSNRLFLGNIDGQHEGPHVPSISFQARVKDLDALVWRLPASAALCLHLKILVQNEGFHAAHPTTAECMKS
jgi:hypothetical protein